MKTVAITDNMNKVISQRYWWTDEWTIDRWMDAERISYTCISKTISYDSWIQLHIHIPSLISSLAFILCIKPWLLLFRNCPNGSFISIPIPLYMSCLSRASAALMGSTIPCSYRYFWSTLEHFIFKNVLCPCHFFFILSKYKMHSTQIPFILFLPFLLYILEKDISVLSN
jgi:hypothetical protein